MLEPDINLEGKPVRSVVEDSTAGIKLQTSIIRVFLSFVCVCVSACVKQLGIELDFKANFLFTDLFLYVCSKVYVD